MEYFGSLDDMLNAMKQAEDEANQRTTQEQSAIGYGDYFLRIWEGDRRFGGPDLNIYGYIMTRDEFITSERGAGADDAELSWTLHTHDDSYKRGYRFGWCYSIVEPDGELGSTHVSTMIKITGEEFEAARKRGWK